MSPDTPRDTGSVDDDNPWPGLAAFREADHRYFQGRDTVIDELARIVVRSKLTVLHGVSGLGKTSLLRAGLFPQLRTQHVMPVYVRLRHADDSPDLVEQVRDAIDEAAKIDRMEAPAWTPGSTLWECFHRKNAEFWDARNRIVMPLLVFDQFEELFTLGRLNAARRERTEEFLDELCDLVEGRPPQRVRRRLDANPEEALQFSLTDQPCKVLISLREDFLSDLTDLRPRMPTIANRMFRLRPMTATEALRVVGVGGRLVDPQIAERIVEFVGAAGSDTAIDTGAAVVEPALLSVFCRELNNKRRDLGHEAITERLLEGSRASIITDFYERTISAESLSAAVRVFVEEDLITESGFRDSVAEEQALATRAISAGDIDALITSRLLRREDVGTKGRSRLELTHDVLANAVRVSRDHRRMREQQERETVARQAAEARAREEVERAREAAEMARVSREEQRAREDAERIAALERRGRRRQLVWSSVILVLVATLGAYAWNKAAETRRALSAAHLDRVARGEPRALAYLARAVRDDPTSVAARALLISYLSRQVLQTSRLVHDRPLRHAALDAAGVRVLTRDESGVVRLWDARNGQPIEGALGQTRFTTAAFSPDGSRMITVSDQGLAEVRDAATGAVRGEPLTQDGPTTTAAFDRTGTRVVTVSGQRIGIRNLESGTHRTIDAQQEIASAVFDPTSTYVLSISAQADANIWLVQSGERLAHLGAVAFAMFTADGSRVVAALDKTAQIIDARTGSRVGPAMNANDPIVVVDVDPAGERVLTASGGTVQFWNASTGEPAGRALQHAGSVLWAGFSPDGERVLTASEDGIARLWETHSGLEIGTPLRHGSAVVYAAFSGDGATVVTASKDGTATVWDARTGVLSPTRLRHARGRIGLAAISRDGTVVATAGALDVEATGDAPENTAYIWDPAHGRVVGGQLKHGGAINSLDFDHQATRLITTSDDHTARIWNVRTGEAVVAALQHTGPVLAATFSPDGTHVVTASSDGAARIWNAVTGRQVGDRLQHEGLVVWVTFSPDGRRVFTASGDGTARVWNGATGQPEGSAMKLNAPVLAAALNADGSQLVTAADGYAVVWDVGTRQQGGRVDHKAGIGPPVFSTDGRQLITMPPNAAMAFVRDLRHEQRIVGQLRHETPPVAAAASGSGLLLTASEAGTAHLWDIRSRLEVGLPLRHENRLRSATASADGSRILVVEEGAGIAWIWDVVTGTATDARALAELAEVIGGHVIDTSGELTETTPRDRQARLAELRERANRDTEVASPVDAFVKWLLSDPAARTVSPFSKLTVPDYVQRLLSEGESGRREAQRLFPGHPAHTRPRAPGF